jgi:peptidoglycan hydrolase CwlO-like protein
MVFPCTSYERLFKKYIVNLKNSNYSECTHYSHQYNINQSIILQQIDAKQLKLLIEVQKAEAEVSELLFQASEISSCAHHLRKQVDFLESRTKKIVKGKFNSLEALHEASIDLSEGFSSFSAIASSFPF